jgi:hypothetical protein
LDKERLFQTFDLTATDHPGLPSSFSVQSPDLLISDIHGRQVPFAGAFTYTNVRQDIGEPEAAVVENYLREKARAGGLFKTTKNGITPILLTDFDV